MSYEIPSGYSKSEMNLKTGLKKSRYTGNYILKLKRIMLKDVRVGAAVF